MISNEYKKLQIKKIAFREWLILSILLLALTAALSLFRLTERMDLVMYDRIMQINTQPARDDILIVAIDDYSLAELGRWPWPRAYHAKLLSQINAAKPAAVGLDILFTEAEAVIDTQQAGGDQQLADAIQQSNKVVLPLVSESAGKGLTTAKPVPILANAARQLSHIHLELDKDGIARSVFLREGMQGEWWPHFALAMKDVGQNIAPGTEKYLPGVQLSASLRKAERSENSWQRDFQMHIPFAGSSGHFQSVPYVSVLRGEVPASLLQGKYIIVGPMAIGMADSYPTPVTGNEGVISGVEINANILASLLNEKAIQFALPWQIAIWNILVLILALIAYQFLSPRKALISTVAMILLCLAGSLALMRWQAYWVPMSPAVIALLLAYPLWSWRRLEAAIKYLAAELTLLEQEPHLLPEFTDDEEGHAINLTDTLEKSIQDVHLAANRVRDLRQFISDSLASLPDATLVTTTDGNVLLSNQAARAYFAGIGQPKVNDALVPYLFANMSAPANFDHTDGRNFSWWDILDIKLTKIMSQGFEVRDPRGQDLLIKSAPAYNADKHLVGWIVSIVNITAIRAAERSRDETLHFISHDMRSPQASILALLEMQKEPQTALPTEEFMSRIEKASRITLGLADNFVQLARAESQDYRYEEVDFQDVLLDATEEMWSLSRSKNIRFKMQIPEQEYLVRIDRALMTRVLTNLISNAIKYSPRDTTINCSLKLERNLADVSIICSIQDQGYGIARSEQSKLFQRFQRFKANDQPKNDGVGLGMVFVKAVLDRHYASIDFVSAPNEGTTFHIRIPGIIV